MTKIKTRVVHKGKFWLSGDQIVPPVGDEFNLLSIILVCASLHGKLMRWIIHLCVCVCVCVCVKHLFVLLLQKFKCRHTSATNYFTVGWYIQKAMQANPMEFRDVAVFSNIFWLLGFLVQLDQAQKTKLRRNWLQKPNIMECQQISVFLTR